MPEHRDWSLYGKPPPEMDNPIGHWYCNECDCLATECTARGEHIWKIKWIEEKVSG